MPVLGFLGFFFVPVFCLFDCCVSCVWAPSYGWLDFFCFGVLLVLFFVLWWCVLFAFVLVGLGAIEGLVQYFGSYVVSCGLVLFEVSIF